MMIKPLLSPTGTDGGGQGTASTDGQGGAGGIQETMNNAENYQPGASGGEELFEGEEGAGEGESGEGQQGEGQAGDQNQGGEGQQGQQGQAGQQGTQGGQRQQAQGGGLDQAAIAALAQSISGQTAALVQQQSRQQQQSQPRQMDEATFKKTFNVYEPSADVLNGLRSEDPKVQVAAFMAMRDGMMKQANTMAEYRLQEQMEKIMGEHITPVRAHMEAQATAQARETFWRGNPALRPFEAIVDSVALQLNHNGKLANLPVVDGHKLIAAETKKVLQAAGVNLPANGQARGQQTQGQNNGNGQQRQSGPAARSHRMSTLASGGQSGGGGNRGGGGSKGPAGIEVFDE